MSVWPKGNLQIMLYYTM